MILGNADDILKQMEDEAEQEAKKAEEEEDDEQIVDETPPVEDDKTDEEDDEEEAVTGEDPKKRGNAFARLRHERKELESKLEEERKARSDLAERLARLEGRAEATPKQEAKTEEDAEPDALLYPDDHNAWKIKQLEKKLEQVQSISNEAKQHQQYQNEVRGMNMLDAQYKTANPKADFDGAVKYLVEREKAAKKLMYPNLSDAQIDAQIEGEKLTLYRGLYSSGRNPSEVLYNLAKTHGFSETAPKKTTDLGAVERNQRRGANLIGGSPASKENGKVTSEDILNMSFQKALKGSYKANFFETEE